MSVGHRPRRAGCRAAGKGKAVPCTQAAPRPEASQASSEDTAAPPIWNTLHARHDGKRAGGAHILVPVPPAEVGVGLPHSRLMLHPTYVHRRLRVVLHGCFVTQTGRTANMTSGRTHERPSERQGRRTTRPARASDPSDGRAMGGLLRRTRMRKPLPLASSQSHTTQACSSRIGLWAPLAARRCQTWHWASRASPSLWTRQALPELDLKPRCRQSSAHPPRLEPGAPRSTSLKAAAQKAMQAG